MEARFYGIALAAAALSSLGATYSTPNFVVTAPTSEIAQQVAEHAEHYRREIAIKWLGQELPRWFAPCPVVVKVGAMGAGGATSFSFDRGHVFGWNMNIQGSLDRILDSVLPHEVSHTIFACHFRRPLPRWADEGAATLAEDDSEKRRQRLVVKQVLSTRQRIPLTKLLRMTEYPSDEREVLNLYAEGYALCELLVQRGGKERYLTFLADAHQHGWERAIKMHYGYKSIESLEKDWEGWIVAGCPAEVHPPGQLWADARSSAKGASRAAVVRSQSPDEEGTATAKPMSRGGASSQVNSSSKTPRGQGLEAPQPRRRTATAASLPTQIQLGASAPISGFDNASSASKVRQAASPERGWVAASGAKSNVRKSGATTIVRDATGSAR